MLTIVPIASAGHAFLTATDYRASFDDDQPLFHPAARLPATTSCSVRCQAAASSEPCVLGGAQAPIGAFDVTDPGDHCSPGQAY